MKQTDCPKWEDCSAPLCPLQQNRVDAGIFYPDEEICKRRDFQNLGWIRQALRDFAKGVKDKKIE